MNMIKEPMVIEDADMDEYIKRWLEETKEAYPALAGEEFFGDDLEELDSCA